MNWTGALRGLLIGAVTFCVAGSDFMGVNPLVVGLFLGMCILGENTLYSYIGGVLGLVVSMPVIDVIRYGLTMIIVAAFLGARQAQIGRGRELFNSFMAGVLLIGTSLSVDLVADVGAGRLMLILEGAIAFSAGMIFYYALRVIKQDYGRIATENEAAISCMALGAAILYGIPLALPGGIVLGIAVAVFSIITVVFKFNFGIGMSWSVLSGFIMSYRTDVDGYFLGWLLVAMGALGIGCLLGGGRFLFGLVFAGLYMLVGTYFYPDMMSEAGVKALSSALLVFLLAPKRLMLKLDDTIRGDALSVNSPEWGRLMIDRMNNLAAAFKRIDYTLAGDGVAGMGFKDVGNIIYGFTNQLERSVPLRKTIEAAIINELALRDIHVKNLVLIKNQEERYEVYITSKVKRGRLVMATTVRDIVAKEMGIPLELKSESRNMVSRSYELICLRQRPAFECRIATRVLSRYEGEVSGDNFYVGDILDGQKLIMLADGMGNGKAAATDSTVLLDSIEELLMAGFDKETSIKIVNTYLADKNKGERFSTLDMLIMDLHTGYGRLYKQGAATTFVRRGEWIELIKSTSLPMGVIDGAVCETCRKKFYTGDVILMVSDGVLESIVVENKEDYLRDLLLGIPSDEPEEIATAILSDIKGMSGNRLKDDASLIVMRLVKK